MILRRLLVAILFVPLGAITMLIQLPAIGIAWIFTGKGICDFNPIITTVCEKILKEQL